jgi:hypothetical protein
MDLRRGRDERVAGLNRTSYRPCVSHEPPASIGHEGIDLQDSALKPERQLLLQPSIEAPPPSARSQALDAVSQFRQRNHTQENALFFHAS